MQTAISRVVLIDDDPLSNVIHQKFLKKYLPVCQVIAFEDGLTALAYLRNEPENNVAALSPMVILLDMEMPAFDGWEFLEAYDQLPPAIHKISLLYMLSSGINPSDMRKAQANPMVKAYFSKPLTVTILERIGSDWAALSA